MALKEAAGWNQTEDDWRLLLELLPEGCFSLEQAGRVIATSTAAPYGNHFGWVGMMLVDPRERRKGHGTTLLHEAVSCLEERGLVVALDATPVGKTLYDRHDFRDLLGLERWTGVVGPGFEPHPGCSALGTGDVEAVLDLDLEAFGADRSRLLRGLLALPGASGLLFREGGSVEGYLLARPGSRFGYIGPWVCRTAKAARALWETALSEAAGEPMGVDVPVPNSCARALAAEGGLTVARTPVRMVRHPSGVEKPSWPWGEVPPGGRPDLVHGLAGLEWG